MSDVSFTPELRVEYQMLFNTAMIRSEQIKRVDEIVAALEQNRSRYVAVGKPLQMPWYFIAVIHNMESSRDFTKHLHNGDPLTSRTVHVPKGRPKKGEAPFSREESATDAIIYHGLDQWHDWSLPGMLYKIEEYNGWGYRLNHPQVLSPYLWSGSAHYTSGKYIADGQWSDTTVSTQIGAAVLLRRMGARAAFLVANPAAATVLPVAPALRYSTGESSQYAEKLQLFLNTFPGIKIKVDGFPGAKTSTACKQIFGHYLSGDPRNNA
jgi:lysozyme family protein